MDIGNLYAEGYRQGAPPPGFIDAAAIDGSICSESKCDNCGHQGMDYKPFLRDNPHSYRAFAVCPECGEGFEF
ncbi:unnamed protein product [marine sediment metagenome]|uniref:Uncharacterized protein n=1 Tax=marine sediment metagenome TaxID=412755 RepID=X1VK83_9ZZZZ